MNMFDGLFAESLVNLDAADASWNDKRGPFIRGEELDINDDELVKELTEYTFRAPKPQED